MLSVMCFYLQNCVEQIFDEGDINVSKNSVFAEEFAFNIRSYLSEIEPRIGKRVAHEGHWLYSGHVASCWIFIFSCLNAECGL